MLYFSGIINSEVIDASEKVVGKLKDVLVKSSDGKYAPLEYLVVSCGRNGLFYVPYSEAESISKAGVMLRQVWSKVTHITERPANLLSLEDDVFDQQVIDINGARVVRSNDIRFAVIDDKMCVVGIDVSVRGLFRRMGLLWLDVFNLLKTNLIDWREAQPVHGVLKVGAVAENFQHLHPADMADIIEKLYVKRGSKIVSYLEPSDAAKVLEEMDEDMQKKFLRSLDPTKIRQIMDNMSTDEMADLIHSFSKRDAEVYMSFLTEERRKEVKKLLAHDDKLAGGLMSADYITVQLDWTVEQVMNEIKKKSSRLRSLLYVYVVTEQGIFRGAISLRRILLAKPNQKLRDIMRKSKRLPTLHVHDDIGEICDIMTRYNLFSSAVLDKDRKILGVVTIDDVMRVIRPRA